MVFNMQLKLRTTGLQICLEIEVTCPNSYSQLGVGLGLAGVWIPIPGSERCHSVLGSIPYFSL